MPKAATPRVKRQPQRTCVACREIEGKRTLLRVVRTPDGDTELDPKGKKSGRGAYVHAAPDCIQLALRSGGLARALRVSLNAETEAALRAVIDGPQPVVGGDDSSKGDG